MGNLNFGKLGYDVKLFRTYSGTRIILRGFNLLKVLEIFIGVVAYIMRLVKGAMPIQWYEAFGFSLKLSYNEWIILLRKTILFSYVIKEKLGLLDWKERYSVILNARYSDSLY